MATLPAPITFGSQFGAGLGAGLAESLPEKLDQFITIKRSEREKTSVKRKIDELGPEATLQDKMGIWLSSSLSPEDKKQGFEILKQEGATSFAQKFKDKDYTISDLIEGATLGYIPPGLAQEMARPLLRDPMEQQLLQQFFGGNGQPGEERPQDIYLDSEERVSEGPAGEEISDVTVEGEIPAPSRPTLPATPRTPQQNAKRKELLQRMMATKGPAATLAKSELASMEKAEERGFQQKEKKEKREFEERKRTEEAATRATETKEKRAFDRSKGYLDSISDIAKELPKEKLALSQMRGALDDKDFNSFRNVIAEMTGIEALKTKSAQVVNSASKQFLMASLAGLTGRPNQFIERQITKALVSPLYHNEANELIYEGLEGLHNLKKREVEIAEDLEEFYTEGGGEIPRNFQKLVRAQHKKEVDAFETRYKQRVTELLSSKDVKSNEVRMRDPQGNLRNVPKKDVEAAKAANYKVVR